MPGQNKYCRDNHGGLICMKLFWSAPQRLSAALPPPSTHSSAPRGHTAGPDRAVRCIVDCIVRGILRGIVRGIVHCLADVVHVAVGASLPAAEHPTIAAHALRRACARAPFFGAGKRRGRRLPHAVPAF